jgi:hypothetical protein
MCSFYLPSPVSSIEAKPHFIEGQLKAGDQGATSLQSSRYRREQVHGCVDMGFSNSRLLDVSLLSFQSPVELRFLRKAPKGRSDGQLPQ